MTVDCTVIDLPFKEFNNNPFCIYFVYTPERDFIIKGLSCDITSYIKDNIQQYVCKYTMWQNGKVRAEGFISSHCIYIKKEKLKNRVGYSVIMYDKNYKRQNLFFRNFPKKWLSEYDIAKIK